MWGLTGTVLGPGFGYDFFAGELGVDLLCGFTGTVFLGDMFSSVGQAAALRRGPWLRYERRGFGREVVIGDRRLVKPRGRCPRARGQCDRIADQYSRMRIAVTGAHHGRG